MAEPTPEERAGRLLAELPARIDGPHAQEASRLARLFAAEIRAAEEAAFREAAYAATLPRPPEVALAEVRAALADAIGGPSVIRHPALPDAELERAWRAAREMAEALGQEQTLALPQAAGIRPGPLMEPLRRLLWLLGLPPGERRFVTAAADDAADFAGLAVFCDWLEEEMRDDDAGRVRKLTPRTGDVLVLRIPDRTPGQRDAAGEVLRNLREGLKALGVETLGLALAPGWDLEALRPEALAGTGLCRAQDALYLHRPGQLFSAAARLAVEGGYAGLAVNEVALLRQEGETAAALLMRCFMEADRRGREG